jgi:hypothetical protein
MDGPRPRYLSTQAVQGKNPAFGAAVGLEKPLPAETLPKKYRDFADYDDRSTAVSTSSLRKDGCWPTPMKHEKDAENALDLRPQAKTTQCAVSSC